MKGLLLAIMPAALCTFGRAYTCSAKKLRNILQLREKDHRFLENGERIVKYTQESMMIEGKERCSRCWFYKSMCICSRVADLTKDAEPVKTDIALFMHYKEYGKTTNTGKLVQMITGERCAMHVYGTADADVQLLSLCQDVSKQPVLLYPTASSRPISEFRRNSTNKPLVLCVIDSTWGQSKAMHRWFPDSMPRVHIDDDVLEKSLFLSRKQSVISSKISTLEAIEKALIALGETSSAVSPFIPTLKLSVDVSSLYSIISIIISY